MKPNLRVFVLTGVALFLFAIYLFPPAWPRPERRHPQHIQSVNSITAASIGLDTNALALSRFSSP